jgi:hypothetical protein
MLLADAAQEAAGKLYILGGGWSVTGPQMPPMAIALKIDVPWTEANRRHQWELVLTDDDGQPVMLPAPDGIEQRLTVGGDFEVGRPPGVAPGSDIDLPVAVTVGPLPLPPGRRYAWRLSIDGETHDEWVRVFAVRPGPS